MRPRPARVGAPSHEGRWRSSEPPRPGSLTPLVLDEFALEPGCKEELRDVWSFLERAGRGSVIVTSRDTAGWFATSPRSERGLQERHLQLLVESESNRPRLEPEIDEALPPPPRAPLRKAAVHPRPRRRRA